MCRAWTSQIRHEKTENGRIHVRNPDRDRFRRMRGRKTSHMRGQKWTTWCFFFFLCRYGTRAEPAKAASSHGTSLLLDRCRPFPGLSSSFLRGLCSESFPPRRCLSDRPRRCPAPSIHPPAMPGASDHHASSSTVTAHDKSATRPYKCPYPPCGRAFSRLEHQVCLSVSSSPPSAHRSPS